MKFKISHYYKKRPSKITFFLVAILIFVLPINKGMCNETLPLNQTSIERSNNQAQEQYFSICEEVLRQKILELQKYK